MALTATILADPRPVGVREALETLARPGPGGRRALASRDASFAQRLLRIGAASWEPATIYAAWKLARRHQRSLLERGIDFYAIVPPRIVGGGGDDVRYVYARADTLVLAFSFDAPLQAAAQRLPEVRYDPVAKEYSFPPTNENADALRDLLKQHPGFTVTEEALRLLRATAHRHQRNARHLRFEGGAWWLTMPPPATPADWGALAQVTRIPRACYREPCEPGQQPRWEIDPSAPGALPGLAALVAPGSRVSISASDRAMLPARSADGEGATTPAGSAVVDFTGRTFKLTFPPRPALLEAVRELDGARFERPHGRWSTSRTTGNAGRLRSLVSDHGFELTDAAAGEVARMESILAARAAASTRVAVDGEQAAEEIRELELPLRPFQITAVKHILHHRRILLGDEPGLGKTLDALTAIKLAGAYPAIVVAPATLKLTWRMEARTWFPGMRVVVLKGEKANADAIAGAELIVVNYEIAHAWRAILAQCHPKALLVDESHYLANGSARRTQIVTELGDLITDDGLIIAISATALVNCPRELVPQLVLLRKINDFGGVTAFKQRFCGLHKDVAGRWDDCGATNLQELHDRLRDGCLVRRLKADVLDDLPAKLPPAPVVVEITNRRAYTKLTKEVVAELLADRARVRVEEEALRDGATADSAAGAGRAAAAKARCAAALVLLSKLRALASAGKVKAACGWVTDFLQSGQKLVVFSDVTPTQQALAEAFPAAAHILATDTPTARQSAVERFQTDPDCRLMICSLRLAGTGLTLHAASNVVFIDLPWHDAALTQATDRVHRIGQHHPVTPWFLVAHDTVDVEIAAVIARKAAISGQVLDGNPAPVGDATAATVTTVVSLLLEAAVKGPRPPTPAVSQQPKQLRAAA